MSDPAVASALIRFARKYSSEGRVGLESVTGNGAEQQLPKEVPSTEVGVEVAAGVVTDVK